MRSPRYRIPVVVAIAAALVAALVAPAGAADAPPPTSADRRATQAEPPDFVPDGPGLDMPAATPENEDPIPELRSQALSDGRADVLVEVGGGDPTTTVAAVLAGTDHEVQSTAEDVVAIEASVEAIDRLQESAQVDGIWPNVELELFLDQSVPHIRADSANVGSRQGNGRRIAVIDSGVYTDDTERHPAFAGAVDTTNEACFVSGPTDPCPRTTGPGAAAPCTAGDCDHGSHVASIALGRSGGGASRGVAPGATLIPIRIFHRHPTNSARSTARVSDLLAALDHVQKVDADGTQIDAVNLSLGFIDANNPSGSYGNCDGVVAPITDKIAQLRRQGVVVVVASGNGSSSSGISFPACVSGATPVAATLHTSDEVADISDTGPLVSIAAPGTSIRAAVGSTGTAMKTGTSMAAPHVSGAVALLREQSPSRSVASIERRLWDTGVHVTDPDNGLQLRRIDVAAALGTRSPRQVPPADVLWAVTNAGRVFSAGHAQSLGSAPPLPSGENVVAGSATRSGMGYWLVTNRGKVYAFGDADFAGDMSGTPLNGEITGMTTTASGNGYWLLGSDGGVFSFGDAAFYGSTGGMRLNAPVTDMARTPTGRGYWFTAKDGGVFSFGDARFYGSTGSMTLNEPVVSIAAGPTKGYWLVALDGGVFAFSVPFHGSLPQVGLAHETGYRVRGTAGGRGYYITTLEGGVYPFGTAEDFGRVGPLRDRELAVDLMIPGS